jgi:hypothetical protein
MTQAWQEKREKVISTAAYRKAWDKALAARGEDTKCPHGHDLTKIENAHVGDLRRTGKITCDPCNRKAQKRYAGESSPAPKRKAAKKVSAPAPKAPAPGYKAEA